MHLIIKSIRVCQIINQIKFKYLKILEKVGRTRFWSKNRTRERSVLERGVLERGPTVIYSLIIRGRPKVRFGLGSAELFKKFGSAEL